VDTIKNIKSKTRIPDNDFYKVRYMVNNQQRAHQLQASIMEDMRKNGIKAIMPPDISSYMIAFLNIANTVLGKSWSKAGSTLYSEEREQFLMYEIATEVLGARPGNDPFKRNENRRHNLVSDTRDFIKQVITYKVWDKIAAAAAQFKKDEPETLFIDFINLYFKKASEYSGNKFFDIFLAYKELYEFLNNGGRAVYDGIILIEDFELMEPIFQDITLMLEKCGVRVIKTDKFDGVKGGVKRELYHCMTPLDEAEIVSFRIKEFLSKGIAPCDISVINYNSETAELIKLVFDRFGIAYYSEETIGSTPAFELLKSAVMMQIDDVESAEHYLMLLGNPVSACRLSNFGFSVFKSELNSLGYKTEKDPRAAVSEALKLSFIKREEMLNGESDETVKTERKKVLAQDEKQAEKAMAVKKTELKVSAVLEEVIEPERVKNTGLLEEIIKAAAIMDELLIKSQSAKAEDRQFLVEAMFSITAAAEYMEYTDPAADAVLTGNVKPREMAGAYVSMSDPKSASTLSSPYVFITGLDAGMDKKPVTSYPAALGNILGLPLSADKMTQKYNAFAVAFENAPQLTLSYAYIRPGGTVLGTAAALKSMKEPSFKITEYMNEDKSLLRGFDIIAASNEAPDETYRYFLKDPKHKFGVKEKEETALTAQKIADAIKSKDGSVNISVTALSHFIICPRQFVFEKLAEKAGIRQETLEASARMKRGNLWHLAYRYAADEKALFNSCDEKKTLKALLMGMEKAVKEIDPEITEERSAADIMKEAEVFTMPVFAANEVQRRKKLGIKETIMTEKEISLNCGGFLLRGKADRIDRTDTGYIVWDYKTGNVDMADFHLLSYGNSYIKKPKDKHKFNADAGDYAIQLSAYMHMLPKSGGDDMQQFRTHGTYGGGIIYINGADTSDTMEAIIAQSSYAAALAAEGAAKLGEFIKLPLTQVEKPGHDTTGLTSASRCSYCAFRQNCRILVMGGENNA